MTLLYVTRLPMLESEDEALPLVAQSIQRRQLRETDQQALIKATNLLVLPGVSELLEDRHSGVPTTIARAAEKQSADLIVMAPHGCIDLGETMLGCIAERVLFHAAVSVLFVERIRHEIHAAA
ncbi:universal stress protein [Deinococcus sp. UYEF24]